MDYDPKTAKILYKGDLAGQKKIIMEEFNFYKTQRIMHALKWTYWNSHDPIRIGDIKKTANYVLNEVIENPEDKACISTGGFQAKKLDGDFLILQFIPEEWSAGNDDISENN